MPIRRSSMLLVVAALAAAPPRPARADAPAPTAAEDEAKLRFARGRELLKEGSYDAALAEFLASRALVPTRGNTQNAAVCLRQLGRFDEALDLFEAMRKDFPLDEADRASVEGEIDRLRVRVGAVDVTASEPSATVLVDGIERGRTPLAAPIRINAGTHDVRVLKRGFRPFEAKVAVAGGQAAPLVARLEPLTSQGRLVVTEEAGRPARVEIDHALVGETPWEGSLAPGVHVVVLHGDGAQAGMGTQPATAPVRVDEVTPLRLALEPLPGALRVEPQPASAHVLLDAVELGRGVWEGGVRAGEHVVEVTEEGFFPQRRTFTVARGEHARVAVTLERDPMSARWRLEQPARVVFDLRVGVPLAPSIGGGASACDGACSSASWLAGASGALRATYELGAGIAFGAEVGGLRASTSTRARSTEVLAVGRAPSPATIDETRALTSLLVGGVVGYRRAGDLVLAADLGVGVAIGSLKSTRQGTYADLAGDAVAFGPWSASSGLQSLYVAPGVRAGKRFGDRFEVGLDARASLFVPFSIPRAAAAFGPFGASDLGLARFADESLVGAFFVVLTPSLYGRYEL